MNTCSGLKALLKKELTIYFTGPIFYITGFFFLLLAGYFFYTNAANTKFEPRSVA